ncbi:MAG: hypothetical protein N2595_03715 [bacterium]|nr:hypothetical protein [bacterium]
MKQPKNTVAVAGALFSLLAYGAGAQVLMMASPLTNGSEEGFTIQNYSPGWSLMAHTATQGPYYRWSYEVQPNNNWWFGGHSVGPMQKLGTVPPGAENDLSKWTVRVETRVINPPLMGQIGNIYFKILSFGPNGGSETNLPAGNTVSWTTHEFTMDKMKFSTDGDTNGFKPSGVNYQLLMQLATWSGWQAASPPPNSNAFAVALRNFTLHAIPEPGLGAAMLVGGLMVAVGLRRY